MDSLHYVGKDVLKLTKLMDHPQKVIACNHSSFISWAKNFESVKELKLSVLGQIPPS